jgi:hypothetical protein
VGHLSTKQVVTMLVASLFIAGCGTSAAEEARKREAKQRAEAQAAETRTHEAEAHKKEEEARRKEEEAHRKEEVAHRKEEEAHRKHEEEQHTLQAEGQTCSTQVDPLLKAEAHLNGDLGVGLNYKEYSDQLSKVNVAYEEVPFKKMGLHCLNQAVGLETAMNEFNKAKGIWETCLQEPESSCPKSTLHPKLEEHWQTAEKHFHQAKEGLEELSQGKVRAGET